MPCTCTCDIHCKKIKDIEKERTQARKFKHYKYELEHDGVIEHFINKKEITYKHGISPSTQSHMLNGTHRTNTTISKFTNFTLKKVKIKIVD